MKPSQTTSIRVALAQINPRVGDISGNAKLIVEYSAKAKQTGAEIVVFPELALTGYPPEDLLLKEGFLQRGAETLEAIAGQLETPINIIGFVDRQGSAIFNAAAVVHNGKVIDVYHKERLPNYGVFDEARYFQPGSTSGVYEVRGARFAVNVCEDIWYPDGPVYRQCLNQGASAVIAINASPFHAGKWQQREEMLKTRARSFNASICYLNTVGGQDELVFDGASVVINAAGEVIARAAEFAEELLTVDLTLNCVPEEQTGSALKLDLPEHPKQQPVSSVVQPMAPEEEIYSALVVGTRDYVRKNGFRKVVIGLSGGIDSALTLAVAVDALSRENVTGVTMPSRFSSSETRSDAEKVAEHFGVSFLTLPIEPVFMEFLGTLSDAFEGTESGIAEENLQSRIRGILLMALSNKFGWLALTTGNKSEMAVGYATIYGDMAGGFAVLKDVPKTLVWKLSRWRNRNGEVIPWSTIERPPSAELRENQKDTDSLPDYDVLDAILHLYVEKDFSLDQIVKEGFEAAIVKRVMNLVDINEYKRRQAPPGVKITPKAFGRDRRLPITNAYRDWL